MERTINIKSDEVLIIKRAGSTVARVAIAENNAESYLAGYLLVDMAGSTDIGSAWDQGAKRELDRMCTNDN